MLNFSEITPGARIIGLFGTQPATITAVETIGENLLQVTFRDQDGSLKERYLTTDDIATLTILDSDTQTSPFSADPDAFRLVAEAQRIKYAALYDPYAAVNSSTIQPLPHQIRAVYEELLPRMPLRYLLADDPGAGKTIMAGLYIKELILRSDCERAIIVAPGGLVEQWQSELADKFNLSFEILSREMIENTLSRNVFFQHDFLIARMDQIARNEDLLEQLQQATWDVAVVDEAHRMSAHFTSWDGEARYTKRFAVGRVLGETAQNLLLMTATPHSGSEVDYQLFMSLLDPDRFAGQYIEGISNTGTEGIMRRMIKEDLLTFDGKPLFPERQAHTVPYELSAAEHDLYEQVTEYVRTEMGRADTIISQGDRRRGNNIGFALTILQRRLASSPEAILRSLMRRHARLTAELQSLQNNIKSSHQNDALYKLILPSEDLSEISFEDIDFYDEELSDTERAAFDAEIDIVVDSSTAARTQQELQSELDTLQRLIDQARQVRNSGTDRKWLELSRVLQETIITGAGNTGAANTDAHKIIIFTEHRDTLTYLHQKIQSLLGREQSVVTIHGATPRDERRRIREQFTNDPETVVLLATDAAGEGLNLQRAHLMVNYDLPWNPNRIEQRFGRIHRIGQRQVCHLYNLLASNTREGDVYRRLLDKLSQMSQAYNGKVFNVLGDKNAFGDKSLRDILLEAIRYGDSPQVQARLDQIIDAGVANGLAELTQERALANEISLQEINQIKNRMEQARERKLSPGYVSGFFIAAFERLGGWIRPREKGQWQITRIPKRVRDKARQLNRWQPLPEAYSRVSFEVNPAINDGSAQPTLIAPGHNLLNTVIELTIEDLGDTLSRGTVFVDDTDARLANPSLLYTIEQRIENPSLGYTASRHFDYVELSETEQPSTLQAPPYLDYRRATDEEQLAVEAIKNQPWLLQDQQKQAVNWAYLSSLVYRLQELRDFARQEADRTRQQVTSRLHSQINRLYEQSMQLSAQEKAGKTSRTSARHVLEQAEDLERRLQLRLSELQQADQLVAIPAVIRGVALVVPSQLLRTASPVDDDDTYTQHATETKQVERRAVDLALRSEYALGRHPEEQSRNNPGFDIRSVADNGDVYFLEVKGRIKGSKDYVVTANEVRFAQTQQDRHRLVLVAVDPESPEKDEIRYIDDAFDALVVSPTTQRYIEEWDDYWKIGQKPF